MKVYSFYTRAYTSEGSRAKSSSWMIEAHTFERGIEMNKSNWTAVVMR
jgi:hypothetical protein